LSAIIKAEREQFFRKNTSELFDVVELLVLGYHSTTKLYQSETNEGEEWLVRYLYAW